MRLAISRRSALLGLALSAGARAQEPAPQVSPTPVPASAPAPAAPQTQAATVTGIDRTKTYYVFFAQTIDVASMRALRRQLAALVEAGVTHIVLVISSPGGLIDPMLNTYSFIRALPVTVDTHAQGFVQSAATVLFLAGATRSADKTARFLFHPSVAPLSGSLNEQQIRERLTQVDAVQSVFAAIYHERTALTDEQLQGFGRSEVILSADEAQQYGVVQAVADLRLPGPQTARMLFLD